MSDKGQKARNHVLEDAEYVSQLSENVSIDNDKIVEFVKNNQKQLLAPDDPVNFVFDISDLKIEERLNLLLAFDSINFSYWGDPKWYFSNGDTKVGGAVGLFTALKKAGKRITNAELLSSLKKKSLKKS